MGGVECGETGDSVSDNQVVRPCTHTLALMPGPEMRHLPRKLLCRKELRQHPARVEKCVVESSTKRYSITGENWQIGRLIRRSEGRSLLGVLSLSVYLPQSPPMRAVCRPPAASRLPRRTGTGAGKTAGDTAEQILASRTLPMIVSRLHSASSGVLPLPVPSEPGTDTRNPPAKSWAIRAGNST